MLFNNLMQFVKETFKYLKKSFFALLVLAAAPAFILGLMFPPFSGVSFIPLYVQTPAANFVSIFWMIFSKRGISHIYPAILALPVFIVFAAFIFSVIEKHFKTGKLMLHRPFYSVNNSLLTILKIIPLALALIAVLLLVQISLSSLVRLVVTGVEGFPRVFDCIWIVIIAALFFFVSIAVTVFMGVWAVIIQIFGFSFAEAFVEAMRTVGKRWLPLILGMAVPIIILITPLVVLNSLPPEWIPEIVKAIVGMAAHLLVIVYYFAYVMVSTFNLANLERRDTRSIVPRNIRYIR